MNDSDQIFEYIQKRSRTRPAVMISDLGLPRRSVYRFLTRLIKTGLIYKEGQHPQVYYVARAIPTQPKPPEQPQVKPLKHLDADSKELERLRQELQAYKAEQARLSHELYETKNELGRKELDLKHQKALVNSRDGSIKQLQDRSNNYYEETKNLRADIEDLQEKLRVAQRQKN